MQHYAYLLLNTILIVSCVIMSMIFLFFPMQKVEGLKKYRISLHFFSLAYIILALFTLLEFIPGKSLISFPIELTLISLQTILFSLSLISLFNSSFVNLVYILKYLIPTLIYVVLSIIFNRIWNNISMNSLGDFVQNYSHPSAALNILFLIFCIAQVIYFTVTFNSQKRKYESKLDDYFADTYQLQLRWVCYCFYGAVVFSLLIITSMFSSTPALDWIVTAVEIIFYTMFGIFYIQYPQMFVYIEQAIYPAKEIIGETGRSKKRLVWDDFKTQIIDNKYYLKPGVTIEDMAQYLKVGRTTLSTFINNEEGMNFNLWINSLRVEEAKGLLIDYPHYNLTQIAELIGYSEPSNFSRQFKLITNQSPSVWRQTCQPEFFNYNQN
jgi:AraC-like DNA-binding protein